VEFFAFGKFMAQLVIALVILHLVKGWLIERNPDSDVAKALAFVTAG
jgi:uncharacterized membrane protein